MSAADVSSDADRKGNSGQSKAQCSPMPLPTLGTQKIIQGNGTNVGTIISLQCPAKHKLVGSQLKCVMATNSTNWEGETYCKPLSLFEDHGFRVAVLASIVSSAIIFFMSMAFITCCLLDCVKEDKRKKKESEPDVWQWEEQAQREDESRSRYNHKGRNNNNNTQEKALPVWESHNPAMCDSSRACRYHQQYGYVPACTSPLAALPGQGYDPPLLSGIPQPALISGPPQYPGPPPSSCRTTSPGLVQISAGPGSLWQHGGQQRSSLSRDEFPTGNVNPTKDFSIRIISV